MTKKEYTEFLSLQEHFEWLHAAEDRAKTKLETFTTDDSEFDELVREAIKVYFEAEIDKAWKKIEGFKTAPTFVADRADAIRYCSENGTTNAGYIKYAVFEHSGGGRVSIPLDILEKADRCCDEFDCDDPKNPCPFKEGGQYDWFRYCFDHGCPDIYQRFHRGEYKIEIKEE